MDYNRQSDEYTWINICNEVPDNGEIINLIWGDDDKGSSLEEMNAGMQKMFDNTIITCTVNYTDGSSQQVDIKVGSRIMTCEEAGEELKPGSDQETVVITFEL